MAEARGEVRAGFGMGVVGRARTANIRSPTPPPRRAAAPAAECALWKGPRSRR